MGIHCTVRGHGHHMTSPWVQSSILPNSLPHGAILRNEGVQSNQYGIRVVSFLEYRKNHSIHCNCMCQSLTGTFMVLRTLRSFRMARLPWWLISTFCRLSIAAGNRHCQQCENQHSLHECVYVASVHLSIILCNSRVQCMKQSMQMRSLYG